jgi:hypothetical protein
MLMEWIKNILFFDLVEDISCGVLRTFGLPCLVRYRTSPDKTKKVNCQKGDAVVGNKWSRWTFFFIRRL